MLRYQVTIGRSLRAQTLTTQKIEATVGCKVRNIMTNLDMLISSKVARATHSKAKFRPTDELRTNVRTYPSIRRPSSSATHLKGASEPASPAKS